MTDEFTEVRFKKSPIKLIISMIIYGIFFITFFSMGFSSEVGLPWIAWIVAAGFLFLITRNIKNLLWNYHVSINKDGILVYNKFITWNHVEGISMSPAVVTWSGIQEILITTKEEKEKHTIFGRKKTTTLVTIPPFTINASPERVEDELWRFYRQFGEPNWYDAS